MPRGAPARPNVYAWWRNATTSDLPGRGDDQANAHAASALYTSINGETSWRDATVNG